jgi:hypothetical protein
MKNILILLMVVLFSGSINSIIAQEANADMNEEWIKAMAPGPMHEMLSYKVGEWNAEVKMWMDPDQPPTISEVKTVCESILGGRYFRSIHTGEMMKMPFEGLEINGYDKLKKKFFSIWLDNMGTGVMMSEGTYDDETKTISYNGSMTGPMGNEMKVRLTSKVIDNDNNVFEMYADMGGKEIKWMEIKYTRVK